MEETKWPPRPANGEAAITPTSGALSRALASPAGNDDSSLLRSRVRLVAATLFSVNAIFVVLDIWIAPNALVGLYAWKVPSFLLALWAWRFAGLSRSTRALTIAGFGTMLGGVILTAPATILVGVPWHTLGLAAATSLGAAALFPWGVATQILFIACMLLPAALPFVVLGIGGSSVFAVGAAVYTLGASVLFARQNEIHRNATREWIDSFRENVERLRLLVEHIKGVFWLTEPDGTALYVSPRFADVWGVELEALRAVAGTWLGTVHFEDRERVARWAREWGTSGADTCEYRIQIPTGQTRWIRDAVFPIVGADGSPWRVARFSMDVTGEKDSERARWMQDIARRTQAAIENERRRMARDLHDELGQVLTGIRLLLSSELAPSGVEVSRKRTEHCVRELDRAMVSLRTMIGALRPPILDELGLAAALRTLANDLNAHADIRCQTHLPADGLELSPEETTAVFRIAQEALTNVVRHAKASKVSLTMGVEDDHIDLRIEDDGVGIESSESHFGVRGMRERAALLNGTLEVRSQQPSGTLVHLRLPRGMTESERADREGAAH